jgi:signal transduction histidine kinase
MINKKKKNPPIALVLVAFSVLVMAINTAVIYNRATEGYQRTLDQGTYETERLRRILADHAELTFLAADLTLRRASERQYFNSLFGSKLMDDMLNSFMIWVDDTPQISAMLMTDATGEIKVIYRKRGYATWMEGKETLASEDYFLVHKESDDPDLLYIAPKQSYIQDKGLIIMTRRITNIDGSFGGMVLAAINNAYLLDFFDSLEAGKGTKMVLLRDDGSTLLSGTQDQHELANLRNLVMEQGVAPAAPVGTQIEGRDPRQLDYRQVRIYSYGYMPNLRLVTGLVVNGRDVFKDWRADRRNDLVFLGMFGLFTLVISVFAITMARQMLRVEQSEQTAVLANQAKTEFLANMSHELRTPLNAVIGFSEMLEAGYFGKLNSKQKERLNDIRMCGMHLLELINDILEFSKGEAGKLELRPEKVDTAKLIQSSVRMFSEKARTEGVALVVEVPANLPPIFVDERKMKQILINLLSNAVKFTPKSGRVTVSAELTEKDEVVITVADTGIGMDEGDIPQALSVFGQVHKDPRYGGTGLGLPLCKMMTEIHGGRFILKSRKDHGTTASVVIPAYRVLLQFPYYAGEEEAAAPAAPKDKKPHMAVTSDG